jgi:hypothetical protein
MKRTWVLLALFAAGCSTAPIADFLDFIAPGRVPEGAGQIQGGVCAPQGALPGASVPLVPPPGGIIAPPQPVPGGLPAQPPGAIPGPPPAGAPVIPPPIPLGPGTTGGKTPQPVPFPVKK